MKKEDRVSELNPLGRREEPLGAPGILKQVLVFLPVSSLEIEAAVLGLVADFIAPPRFSRQPMK